MVFIFACLTILIGENWVKGASALVPSGALQQHSGQSSVLATQTPGPAPQSSTKTGIVASFVTAVNAPKPPRGNKQIVFVSRRDGKAHLYSADSDGSNIVKLTEGNFDTALPAWSPDGKQIAFLRLKAPVATPTRPQLPDSDHADLMIMNADGSQQSKVVDGTAQAYTFINIPGLSPYFAYIYRWSPDSTMLAVAMGNNSHQDIYLVKTRAHTLTKLGGGPFGGTGSFGCGSPSWLPDSHSVMMGCQALMSSGDIEWIDLRTSQWLSARPFTNQSPTGLIAVSPSGKYVFVSDIVGAYIDSLTSNKPVDWSEADRGPIGGPYGNPAVVWAAADPAVLATENNTEIRVTRLNGTQANLVGRLNLADPAFNDESPLFGMSWSPDGQWLTFDVVLDSGQANAVATPDSAGQSCYDLGFGNALCGTANIYAVKPDGTGLTLLLENAYDPAWQP